MPDRNTQRLRATIGDIDIGRAVLRNACTNTDCYWHTVHWKGLYENGCYMLANVKSCIDRPAGITFEEGAAENA